jgi:oligopeptide/dipeptide ABC transporter ATP-binding protein
MNMMEVMVKVKHLKKFFPLGKKRLGKKQDYVYAVDDVSFDVTRGETLGLVGESGCGKSTVGRAIMRLYEPTAGDVLYNGQNLLDMQDEELRKIRKNMSMIFQDPYSSLNPRLQVMDIVAEPLRTHTDMTGPELHDAVLTLLGHVGLGQEHLMRYPHEFSGGQRQRIAIARALALNPSFIILDEPTSALDVSVQAQVLNLLVDLQDELRLTYLFISHNLAVVEHISHHVAIMYLGKIVEMGQTSHLFEDPYHPYTKALLSAVPNPDPDQADEEIILTGDVPSPVNVPSGCRFRTRCPMAENLCRQREPEFREIETGHTAACHLIQI